MFGLSQINGMAQNEKVVKKWSSWNKIFSMDTSVGEIIPVVTENYKFDYRDKSIILKFRIFRKFWQSGLWWKDQNYLIFFQTIHHKRQSSYWVLQGRNPVFVVERQLFKFR